MEENIKLPRRSSLTLTQLDAIAEDFRAKLPRLYESIWKPGEVDEELYQSATGRVVSFLRENVPELSDAKWSEITPIQVDLVHLISGRLEI